jgi:hypothetical protein
MIIEGKHAEVGQGIFVSDIQEGSNAEKVSNRYNYNSWHAHTHHFDVNNIKYMCVCASEVGLSCGHALRFN